MGEGLSFSYSQGSFWSFGVLLTVE
uniref:Uncharacterized protein n=1 Tax=Anguilla anguilla TaxID=7936 RepID=A0A0E9PKW6_ANGAN